MSKLSNLDFAALNLSGDNYLAWALDAKFWLRSKGLGDTIIPENKENEQNKAQAMILLRRHLHESLKNEYLTVEDPVALWSDLKERYEHQKTVILPRARYDWTQLRLQDYKSVSEYNSALHKIASRLALCGEKITEEDKLEKTFSTFHANNMLLQTQYREKGFTKYSQLISCLLVAEEQNQLLLKNHGMRPTGSAPPPKANTASFGKKNKTTVITMAGEVAITAVVVAVVVIDTSMVEAEEYLSRTLTLRSGLVTNKREHHLQVFVTVAEETTIGLVCVVHQNTWLISINNP